MIKNPLKKYNLIELVRYSINIPRVIYYLKNWATYLKTYLVPHHNTIIFRNGLKLYVDTEDDVSSISVIFFKKEYGVVKNKYVVLDIGANKGYFSIYAANSVKDIAVYSFEPIKETYLEMIKNINLNKELKQKIKTFNVGVAKDDSIRSFSIDTSVTNSMVFTNNAKKTQKVKCVSLKSIIKENNLTKIDLLKMDCEGAEFEILLNTNKKELDIISNIRLEYHNVDENKLNVEFLKKYLIKSGFKEIKRLPCRGYESFLGVIWFKK